MEKSFFQELFLCDCAKAHSPATRLLAMVAVGVFGLLFWWVVAWLVQTPLGLNSNWFNWRVPAVCLCINAVLAIATTILERAASVKAHRLDAFRK